MRKLILSFVILPFISNAQSFEGFDKIKIGLTEKSFINDVVPAFTKGAIKVTSKNRSKYSMDWLLSTERKKGKVYFLDLGEELMNYPHRLYRSPMTFLLKRNSAQTRLYYMPVYKFGAVEIDDVFLTFYNGKLALIECEENKTLTEAAVAKYRPTEVVDTSYYINCKFVVTGVDKKELVFKKIIKWENSASKATSYQDFDYDSKCKLSPIIYMQFVSTEMLDYAGTLKNKRKEEAQKEENDKIKSVQEGI